LKTLNIRKNIESGLKNLYPSKLQGNPLRRFNTLISMVSGLIASQHVSLGKIADNQPGKIYSLSQVKKNERWLDNGLIDSDRRCGRNFLYSLDYQDNTRYNSPRERTDICH
jgi:hypothetical protein